MRSLRRFLLAALVGVGCGGSHPKRTKRPEISVAPWEARTVRSPQTCHTYEYLFAAGPSEEAPALLLLPGGFFDYRIWLNAHRLSERFNLYVLNWPDNSLLYTGRVEDHGAIAHDFLQTLGLKDIYLGGVSAGSFASIDLVTRYPDIQVRALFLVATVMFGITEKEVKKRTRLAGFGFKFAPERMLAIIDWQVGRTKFHQAPGELQMQDIFYVRPYSYYYQVFGFAVNQGAKKQPTMDIQIPTLVMIGSSDDIMDVEVARLTPTVFPDAELREFEGFEHDMAFTHGPELVDAMFEFLDRRGLGSAP